MGLLEGMIKSFQWTQGSPSQAGTGLGRTGAACIFVLCVAFFS